MTVRRWCPVAECCSWQTVPRRWPGGGKTG